MTDLIFTLESPSGNTLNISHVGNNYTLFYPCSSISSCTPYVVSFSPGLYNIEVWGASGGRYGTSILGGGGYSSGLVSISSTTVVYIYLGGQGGLLNGGWNGGGQNVDDRYVLHGGGGTDFRFFDKTLYHRGIVAGGSGGTTYNTATSSGAGGGLNGIFGAGFDDCRYPSNPGTQEYGGVGVSNCNNHASGTNGEFGIGGKASGVGMIGAGAGGGGWYGGGAAANGASGAGGSGYVLTSTSYKPTGYQLGSEFYFEHPILVSGLDSFPSPSGGFETGHFGNGAARISLMNLIDPSFPQQTSTSPINMFYDCTIPSIPQFRYLTFLTVFSILLLSPLHFEANIKVLI